MTRVYIGHLIDAALGHPRTREDYERVIEALELEPDAPLFDGAKLAQVAQELQKKQHESDKAVSP